MIHYLNPDEVQAMVGQRQQQLSTEYQNACANQVDDLRQLERLWLWLGDHIQLYHWRLYLNLGQSGKRPRVVRNNG